MNEISYHIVGAIALAFILASCAPVAAIPVRSTSASSNPPLASGPSSVRDSAHRGEAPAGSSASANPSKQVDRNQPPPGHLAQRKMSCEDLIVETARFCAHCGDHCELPFFPERKCPYHPRDSLGCRFSVPDCYSGRRAQGMSDQDARDSCAGTFNATEGCRGSWCSEDGEGIRRCRGECSQRRVHLLHRCARGTCLCRDPRGELYSHRALSMQDCCPKHGDMNPPEFVGWSEGH